MDRAGVARGGGGGGGGGVVGGGAAAVSNARLNPDDGCIQMEAFLRKAAALCEHAHDHGLIAIGRA